MGLPSTAPKPDLIQPGLDQLAGEIEALKRRVSALEARVGGEVVEVAEMPNAVAPALNIEAPSGAVVLLGKALLGIAGAYLLRALTDAAILPRTVGLLAGAAYAGVWLYLAARSAPDRKFVAALDACTSAVILGPLLWEATMRFHAVSSWAAAAVIVAYATVGVALSRRTRSTLAARIAASASALIAAVLLVASQDLIPYTVALLALAAMVEFSACLGFRVTERWLVAVAADLALILLAYIVTRKGGIPEGYVAVSMPAALAAEAALAAIYAASTVALAFRRTAPLTVFEIVQSAAALFTGFGGAIQIAGTNAALGPVALAGGAGCYAVSFVLLARAGRRDRNYFTYATLGFAFLVAGACMVFSGLVLAAALSILAAACCWRGLGVHGAAYLFGAVSVSGLAIESLRELFGSSGAAGYGLSYVLLIAVGLLCYVAMTRTSGGLEPRIAAMVVAAALSWLMAGAAARIVVGIWPAIAPTSRTAVLMGLALALAWCGIRWKRAELVWLVYAFMALGAYKLLTQDLPQERTLPLVVSLLLYGSTLIVLPRILRPSAPGTANAVSDGSASSWLR